MGEGIKANVLLVDDEDQFLEALSSRLETRGYHVDTVTTGGDAIALVEGKSFDAIVLDLAMPGLNGLETLKRIKEKRPDLEIIMLTGHASVESGIEAMKMGAEDYIEKPVDLNTLLEKIGEAKHKRMLVVEKTRREEVKKIIHSKSW
ncbi:MAG: response regulator [Deltaproteobacteria bacterium]|jgi:DNA-binding NtrC family response regulator|nr:response regulator [Deltaproteobacteria bacterium]